MNIILVDDEPLALKMLKNAVSEAVPDAEINAFTKPREALAFAEKRPIHIAFLDINMQFISGIEMAKKLKAIYPKVNIIFSTGYEEYALDAMKLYASGYLLKPVCIEDVCEVMKNLRYSVEHSKRLIIKCFGNFEVFCDYQPIKFKLSRTKELLAYLVDRNGALCSSAEIVSVLFEDFNNRDYYQKLRRDLINTFDELGLSQCIIVKHGGISINRDEVECDYFDFLDGKISAKPSEYMTQYSFAEYSPVNKE
ncbi:MAG: response regulator [Clostridia bacterium]|nr:response regulator [Clostridia bacterium]